VAPDCNSARPGFVNLTLLPLLEEISILDISS
jgi:hypothetical protein